MGSLVNKTSDSYIEEVSVCFCKGKIMVNIDKGYDYFQEAYATLRRLEQSTSVLSKLGFLTNK